jgi:uncharacterized protein (TIGR00299 family) protein
MGRVLYLDCFAGAAGDMLVGALVDLGFSAAELSALPAALSLPGVTVTVDRVLRGALAGRLVNVAAATDHPHRAWSEIDARIAAAALPESVKEKARAVFRRLGEAEAAIHNEPLDHVHFHEVGAVDALIDIVGFCLGLDRLGVDAIVCSPLPLGRGQVNSAHGLLPLPAPATVALLAGAPVYEFPLPGETVTPTGAALISTLAASFGAAPAMVLRGVGYGAGTRNDPAGPPNVVRAMLGDDRRLPETAETTYTIEANIDDMNPEHYEPLAKNLEEAGALDVTLIPCIMKRGRPGVLLLVVCPQSALHRCIEAVFTHSTTLGLRYRPAERAACERRLETVETSFGPVRVKHAYYQGRLVHSKPEYADLLKSGLPLPEAVRLFEEARREKKSGSQ